MMLTFKSDIKKRKQVFTAESFSHPAKCHLGMLLWIVGRYTKPGETILDPMFGSGSTMLATRYGRNVIGVELEQKFVDIAKGNWDKIVSLPKTKFGLGECLIVQGDARNLTGIMVDKIITSPPYNEGGNKPPSGGVAEAFRQTAVWGSGIKYSENPKNVGNLKYGSVDSVITSPPYENTAVPPHTAEGEALRLEIAKQRGVSPDKVSYMDYTKKVDAIVSSPPYEATVKEGGEGTQAWKVIREFKNADNKTLRAKFKELKASGQIADEYGKAEGNIGNLRRDTYLEAMLQVYQQCYKVLKPSGLMILVTKDFIRKGQRILLSIDTIALCEQAGFAYEDWHQRRLTQQSFWRTLYYQKHPEVEKLETEDILVFRKPSKEQLADVKWMQENQPRKHRGTHDPKEQTKGNIGNLSYDGAKVNDEWIKSRQVK